MKRVFFYLPLCFLLLCSVGTALAGIDDFAGTWKNVNPNTRGVTKLRIKVDGHGVSVHAWGKCHPKDCDWGTNRSHAYGPNASSNITGSARAITVQYQTEFSRTILVITRGGLNKLNVQSFTRFTDNSGRSNYTDTYAFQRARIRAVVPSGGKPIRRDKPLQEDCVFFNPNTIRVVHAQGHWKIADGNQWIFDFGNKKIEAERALRIIKHYQVDQSCFVGRPNASFQYMLRSGQAPLGDIRGEDCVTFSPSTMEVKNVDGRWKIADGGHWIFDFEENEAGARKAFRIINDYGFNKSCFVGRPDPSFLYLRK